MDGCHHSSLKSCPPLTVMQPTVVMYTMSAITSIILASSRMSGTQIDAMLQMHDNSCRQLLKRCKCENTRGGSTEEQRTPDERDEGRRLHTLRNGDVHCEHHSHANKTKPSLSHSSINAAGDACCLILSPCHTASSACISDPSYRTSACSTEHRKHVRNALRCFYKHVPSMSYITLKASPSTALDPSLITHHSIATMLPS